METSLSMACKYNIEGCRDEAVARYEVWRAKPEDLLDENM